MHILRIDIEGFRAIKKTEVRPRKGRNVFVGPTGAGKTTLLEALRLLLSVEHAYLREDTFSWYDIHGLKRESGKPVRIGAILSLEDAEWIHFPELEEPLSLDLCAWEQDEEPQSIEAFDENGMMLRVALFYQWDREEPDDRVVAFFPKFASPGHPECRKLTRKQREVLGFWFAPLDQSLWEVASLSSRSKLTRAARDAGWDALGRHGVRSIIEEMVPLTEKHATEHWKQLSEIASTIHRGMRDIIPGLSESDPLRLTAALPENWMQRVLELGLRGGRDQILPLRYEGTGIQRAFTVAAAEACSTSSEGACAGGRVLAIDEPEVGLHPQAQRSLMQKLAPADGQSFVATHSPAILKACGAQDVWRLTSDNGKVEVNAPKSDGGTRAEQALKNADRFWESVSDGLFGRAVLLVEGTTEEGAIPVFDDWFVGKWDYYRGFDACDLTLVGCGGLPNIAPMARAFEAYGVRTIALHDFDFDTTNPKEDERRRCGIADACSFVRHWPDMDGCRNFEEVLMGGTSAKVLRAVLSEWCGLYDPKEKRFGEWLAERLNTELRKPFDEALSDDDDQAAIEGAVALWEHEDDAVRMKARDWFLGLNTGHQKGEGAIFAKSSRYSRVWAHCCASNDSVPEGIRVLFRSLSHLMETCFCQKQTGGSQALEWETNESTNMEC